MSAYHPGGPGSNPGWEHIKFYAIFKSPVTIRSKVFFSENLANGDKGKPSPTLPCGTNYALEYFYAEDLKIDYIYKSFQRVHDNKLHCKTLVADVSSAFIKLQFESHDQVC